VTSINLVNGRKRCIIVACGAEPAPAKAGGIEDWLSLIGQIETYARDEGCTAMAIIGRRGWQRKLKDYRPVTVTLEKTL
jgi:hypothetical protein